MKEAAEQLRDDANELVDLRDRSDLKDKLPHMAKVAIRREVERLREIARVLYPNGS